MYSKALEGNDPNFTEVLAYSARDAFKCVGAYTFLLDKNKGLVYIQDVKVGDIIWSGWGWRKVTNWIHDGVKRGVTFCLQNGVSLTVSPIHRIWVKNNVFGPHWKRASELDLVNDLVMFQQSSDEGSAIWLPVTSLVETKADFYDLTVETDHSYWSNGIISHNTLSASLIELLCLFHLRRSVCHLAAVEHQARKCVDYLAKYLRRPLLCDYVVSKNKRTIEIAWYENSDGDIKSPVEFAAFAGDKTPYQEKKYYVQILVATLSGVNSPHVPFLTLDELDLAPPGPVEEAKMIPAPGEERGELPITFMTSSRKFAFGNVQNEIDRAAESGLNILHWNLIDVTKPCPASRHLPEEPKIPIYVSENDLDAVTKEEYDNFLPEKRIRFTEYEGYAGCIKNCKLFSVCQGRLATKQLSNSKLLKPIDHVQATFRRVSVDTAKAQLMCFGAGTQILMSDGTCKNIEDIAVGDTVITHTGSAQKVTEVFQRLYNGVVCSVSHPSWKGFGDTIVTEEHPYFLNGNAFVPIRDARSSTTNRQKRRIGDYLSLPKGHFEYVNCIKFSEIVQVAKSNQCRSIPDEFLLDEKFGWILGYYLAEGHLSKRRHSIDGREYTTAITFSSHQKESAYHELVREFAKKLQLTTSELKVKQSKHGYTQDIYNSNLGELFEALCGRRCDKKKLHHTLMQGPLEFLRAILNGFWSGDGTKRQNNYKELTTTSFSLACQLFTIASKLGYCPRLKKKPAIIGKKQAYLVWYTDPDYVYAQKRTKFRCNENYNLYRLDSVITQHFNGVVYNIEVEKDHSYIANGVAVHNCWKPSSEGMIYSRFDPEIHLVTAAQMYEILTGEPIKSLTKSELIDVFKQRECNFYAGMDFGYTHAFAVVQGVKDGQRMFIFDALEVPELEIGQMLDLCEQRVRPYNPAIYADTAYPAYIKTFSKHKYRMKEWQKKPGSVQGGIEIVRYKLRPTGSSIPHLYFLKDDEGCELLTKRMRQYRWKLDSAGNPTDVPDETDDDLNDAIRYLVMNVFAPNGNLVIPKNEPQKLERSSLPQYHQKNWVSQVISEHTGGPTSEKPADSGKAKGRKGSFFWDVS